MIGVSDNAIKQRYLHFCLNDKAKRWLKSKFANLFTTFNILSHACLSKYFPLVKTIKLRNEITNIVQFDGESLYEA